MFNRHMLLHESGHDHGVCCEQHNHNEGCCTHHHHDNHHETAELSAEQTLALMTYMLDHNRSHSKELHNIGHALEDQGKAEPAALVFESVHFFEQCNNKLEAALKQVKGE